jgi:hypothetical protein
MRPLTPLVSPASIGPSTAAEHHERTLTTTDMRVTVIGNMFPGQSALINCSPPWSRRTSRTGVDQRKCGDLLIEERFVLAS